MSKETNSKNKNGLETIFFYYNISQMLIYLDLEL